jgi:hypothetical protein
MDKEKLKRMIAEMQQPAGAQPAKATVPPSPGSDTRGSTL